MDVRELKKNYPFHILAFVFMLGVILLSIVRSY
jgi:hypothetical protein